MRKSTALRLSATALAAALGILCFRVGGAIWEGPVGKLPPSPSAAASAADAEAALRREAWERAAPAVDACQEEIEQELTPLVLAPVNAFFDARAARCAAFADHLLSLSSKWAYMKTRVDGGDDAYRSWVAGEVRDRLIDFGELERLLEYRIARYVQEMEARENALLLDLERDLLDRPEFAAVEFPTGAALQEAFARKTNLLAGSVGRDFAYDVSGLVATEIAAIVVARVATKMLVSGGILGTGAALSPESLGITIAAAIAIDAVVSAIMNWASGSREEITQHLRNTIFALRNEVVWGQDDVAQDGLIWELRLLSRERARIRQEAIEQLITQP